MSPRGNLWTVYSVFIVHVTHTNVHCDFRVSACSRCSYRFCIHLRDICRIWDWH